jgi:hypothetical protein
MPQVTLYLDKDTDAKMRAAAETEGKSRSRWLADLIRARLADEWPQAVQRLAGAWKDFPTAEELRRDQPPDLPREPL